MRNLRKDHDKDNAPVFYFFVLLNCYIYIFHFNLYFIFVFIFIIHFISYFLIIRFVKNEIKNR